MTHPLFWKSCRAFVSVFLVMLLGVSPAIANEEEILASYEQRQRQIAEVMESATVFVLVVDKRGKLSGMGSGFVVADGYVLTNAHVVEQGKQFYIANTRLKTTPCQVVKMSRSEKNAADFALLHYSSPVKLPILSLNLQVNRMDRVSAWGYPYMITKFDGSLDRIRRGDFSAVPPVVYTEGTVNTLVRKGQGTNIIHGASIAAGNSGGPLVNSRGEVVGINTWGATDEDEGAFVNGALTAESIVRFLDSCGITPSLARRTTRGVATGPAPAAQAGNAPSAPSATPPATASAPAVPSAVPSAPSSSLPSVIASVSSSIASGSAPSTSAPSASSSAASGLEPDTSSSTMLADARAGDVTAQAALGANYLYGETVSQDYEQAEYWLRKATEGGSVDGRGLLGILYVTADDRRNAKEGMRLLKQAADKDAAYAALCALLLYEGESLGVPRDVDASFHYASKGARENDADAQALLAMLYYYGEGTDQDRQKALQLTRMAMKGDSMLARSLMAWMYYAGDVVQEDSRKAFIMAQDAAEAGESSAMGLLALQYYTGDGVEEDDHMALNWAERGAEQGNEFAQYVLGCLYVDGKVVSKSLPKAWAYLSMAAEKHVADTEGVLEKLESAMSRDQKAQGKKIKEDWYRERGL